MKLANRNPSLADTIVGLPSKEGINAVQAIEKTAYAVIVKERGPAKVDFIIAIAISPQGVFNGTQGPAESRRPELPV